MNKVVSLSVLRSRKTNLLQKHSGIVFGIINIKEKTISTGFRTLLLGNFKRTPQLQTFESDIPTKTLHIPIVLSAYVVNSYWLYIVIFILMTSKVYTQCAGSNFSQTTKALAPILGNLRFGLLQMSLEMIYSNPLFLKRSSKNMHLEQKANRSKLEIKKKILPYLVWTITEIVFVYIVCFVVNIKSLYHFRMDASTQQRVPLLEFNAQTTAL